MWIGIIFIVMVGLYLGWCLFSGRMILTAGMVFHQQSRVIDRETSPKTFWALWAITAAGLAVFTFFFIRTVLS